eukprot:4259666-Pyramimonas_sp.AAC.1
MSQNSRNWSRYCRSLAAQLTSSSKPEPDSADPENPPVEKKRRFGSHGRKEGLDADIRCSVFLKEKNRYCSRPRVDGPTCLQHAGQHIAVPSTADTDEGGAVTTASQDKDSSVKCTLCGTFVVSKKLLRHQKRCNVTKVQRELSAQPFYWKDLNSGDKLEPTEDAMGDKEQDFSASSSAVKTFAARVAQAYAEHVGSLTESSMQLQEGNVLLGLRQRTTADAGSDLVDRDNRNNTSQPDEASASSADRLEGSKLSVSTAYDAAFKHLQQQDSIVANMDSHGLLQD